MPGTTAPEFKSGQRQSMLEPHIMSLGSCSPDWATKDWSRNYLSHHSQNIRTNQQWLRRSGLRTLCWTATKQAHPAWLQERLNVRHRGKAGKAEAKFNAKNSKSLENEHGWLEKLQNNVSVNLQQPCHPAQEELQFCTKYTEDSLRAL